MIGVWALVQGASAGPVLTGELGGDALSGSADWSYKLDAFVVTRAARLLEVAPSLAYEGAATGPNALTYAVYAEDGEDHWELLWDSGPVAADPDIADFQPSPPIDLVLEQGRRYAVGAWFAEGDFAYDYSDPGPNVDLGWARFEGAVWSTSGSTYALPAAIDQSVDTHGYHIRVTAEVLDQDGDGALEDVDCDDLDPGNFPGNLELCDGLDNDCTGVPDDPPVYVTYYDDGDGDGYGDPTTATSTCDGPPGPGWILVPDDCDDADATVHPGVEEICDGVDEDCDNAVDEDPVTHPGWSDADGDGFGDPSAPTDWCEATIPAGVVQNDADCDDTSAADYPGAEEVCDLADNDCDGVVDDGLPTSTFWLDVDGDTYGDRDAPIDACTAPPDTATNPLDCDDGDAERFPTNVETCDGKDNNCDGLAGGESDYDSDGFLDCEDCGSADASVYPGAPPVCDGLDHDCDGTVDAGCPEGDGDTDGGTDGKDGGGCGCASPGSTRSVWAALAVAGLVLRRRRAR